MGYKGKTPKEALAFLLANGFKQEDGCLISHLKPNKKGYVPVDIEGKKWRAHRFVFVMLNGAISNDIQVRHKCDVRNCIEPTHLLPGTAADNSRDMVERGRGRPGTNTKVNIEMVIKMYQMRQAGMSNVKIGLEMGLSHECIRENLRRFTNAK